MTQRENKRQNSTIIQYKTHRITYYLQRLRALRKWNVIQFN